MVTIFHTEASLGWGGQEIRILNESLGMKERGYRVFIIAQKDSMLFERARKAGLDAIPLSFRKKDYPRTFLSLLRLIKELRPAFLITHSSRDSWLGGLVSRISRFRPFVIRTRHISTLTSTGVATSILYGCLPDRVVTTAEAIRAQLIERNKVAPERIISIPTGVDFSLYDPSRAHRDIREQMSLPAGTPLVGMVSVLRSWKGHEFFIAAAKLVSARMPGARFIIAGDGPRKDAIKKLIDENGLVGTVLMLGHRDDVPDVLASLDVLVQPSYANEGVPQSILQAMAMAVPVVASDLPPFREVVRDSETGFLVPSRDPAALAEKMEALLKAPSLRDRFGKQGRALALKRFSRERMLDATEELYEEVLRSGAGRGGVCKATS